MSIHRVRADAKAMLVPRPLRLELTALRTFKVFGPNGSDRDCTGSRKGNSQNDAGMMRVIALI
jgi:hypothetical protein